MPEMTAKEFATKYQGRQVIRGGRIGTIVGYTEYNSVCVDWGGGWNVWNVGQVESIIFAPALCKGFARYNVSELTLVRDDKPVKPYPHTCNVCKKPARKAGKTSMCSNVKCKSWKNIRKQMATTKYVIKCLDKDNFVICPTCGAFAVSSYPQTSRMIRTTICQFDHNWTLEWQFGYKQKKVLANGSLDKHYYLKLVAMAWEEHIY
jgi:hypothetical protein